MSCRKPGASYQLTPNSLNGLMVSTSGCVFFRDWDRLVRLEGNNKAILNESAQGASLWKGSKQHCIKTQLKVLESFGLENLTQRVIFA